MTRIAALKHAPDPIAGAQLPFFELSEKLEALELAESQSDHLSISAPRSWSTGVVKHNAWHNVFPARLDQSFDPTSHVEQILSNPTSSYATDHLPYPALHALPGFGAYDNQIENVSSNSEASPALVLTSYRREVLPLLESLFPRDSIRRLTPNETNENAEEQQQKLSKAQLQFLVYAASNNFAGFPQQDFKMMYSYLKDKMRCMAHSSSNMLVSRRTSLHLLDIPSTKPMAETFFRCAIENGDDKAAAVLLGLPALDISANDFTCHDNSGKGFTPAERASALHYTNLLTTLISFGADVNKTYHNTLYLFKDLSGIYPYPTTSSCGALECAFSASAVPDLGMVSTILLQGGELRPDHLKVAIFKQPAETTRLLLSTSIEKFSEKWMEAGVFHAAVHFCDLDFVFELVSNLAALGVDLNRTVACDIDIVKEKLVSLYENASMAPWVVPLYPSRLVDIAAQRGDLELVKLFVSSGATFSPDTLSAGIHSENLELVSFLIQHGADMDDFSPHYCSTPYSEAVRRRDEDLLSLLIANGCKLRTVGEYERCAVLGAAAEVGDIQRLHELMSACSQGTLGWALYKAVQNDRIEAALILMRQGAATDYEGCAQVFGGKIRSGPSKYEDIPENFRAKCSLRTALRNKNRILVKALIDHDAMISGVQGRLQRQEYTPLELAVLGKDFQIIQDVIYACGPIMTWDDIGASFAIAARRRDLDCVRYLVEAGLDINTPVPSLHEEFFRPPLFEALQNQDVVMVQWLLANGADPSDFDSLTVAMESSPPLLWTILNALEAYRSGHRRLLSAASLTRAVQLGKIDVVQWLLRCGVSQRQHGDFFFEESPLSAAIKLNNDVGLEMVNLILGHGFEIDAPVTDRLQNGSDRCWNSFDTALLVAIEVKNQAIVKLLLSSGANVNLPPTHGIKRTPIQKAAEVGCRSIIMLLLNHGAEVNGRPAERGGATALQLAAINGFIGIVELLLENNADANALGAFVYGRTALEGAAEHGRFDMVNYLHRHCRIEVQQYTTAAELAKDNGHNAVAEQLESLLAERSAEYQGPQSLKCGLCAASMSNVSALRRHERVHRKEFSFQCSQCQRFFHRKDILDRHEKSHGKRDYVVCSSCCKSFRKDYYKRHSETCRAV